jgi:hypothetical protein
MALRTFTFTVQSASQPTVLSETLAQMTAARPSAPMWSSELADTRYRYLCSKDQPLHAAGATAIYPNVNNVLLDTWGGGPAAGGRAALRGFNAGDQSTELLMGNAGPYALTGWDSQTGLWHVAGTTQSLPYSQTIVRYNPATDEIRRWSAAAEGDNTTALWQYGCAHNFGGSALDLVSRRIFRLLRTTGSSSEWAMGWAYIDDLVAGQNRATARRAINSTLISSNDFPPIVLLPNVGSAGTLLVMKTGTADWLLFDLATNQWSGTRTHAGIAYQFLPAKVYHDGYVYMAFARYADSSYTVADTTFWRVPEVGGTPENLGPTPVPMNGGAYFVDQITPWAANWFHTEFVSLGGAIYAFRHGDPRVAGNKGAVWRYNGTWTQVDEMPLVDMGVPITTSGGNYVCYAVCAVPEKNCVVMMNTANDSNGNLWGDRAVLWKP